MGDFMPEVMPQMSEFEIACVYGVFAAVGAVTAGQCGAASQTDSARVERPAQSA